MSVVCDRDCLNCPYPDVPKECLNAPLSKGRKKKSAEYYRAYRARNREKVNAQSRHYYARHRERILEYDRKCRIRNTETYGAKQKVIRFARKNAGLTQTQLGALIGVSTSTVSCWEIGAKKANWGKLYQALPALRGLGGEDEW